VKTNPDSPARSFVWRLIVPVPLVLSGFLLLAWLLIPRQIAESTEQAAIEHAVATLQQYKTIRGYYTTRVVKKVLDSSAIDASQDHLNNPASIPLPATMIHDLSALQRQNNISLNLFSPYPFPKRRDRRLDDFQQAAWDYLVANPEKVFYRAETIDGKSIIRVAIADPMVASACIDCHNSHSESPKTDWQLNDVRGVLEFHADVAKELEAGMVLSRDILLAAAFSGGILVVVCFFVARQVSRPIQKMTRAMRHIAAGKLDSDIPGRDRRDEVGEMAQALEVFRHTAIRSSELESSVATMFANARDSIVLLSRDSDRIEALNPAAEAMFGYDAAVVAGQPLGRLLSLAEDDAVEAEAEPPLGWPGLKRLAANDEPIQGVGTGAGGDSFAVEFVVSVASVGAESQITLSVRNIEERKRREDALYAEWARELSRLSTPISEIGKSIIFLPLVGNIDVNRIENIMDSCLTAIHERGAKTFIIDISAVMAIDSAVANSLIQLSKAMRLMGCKCIISGLSPVIVETIVGQGIDLEVARTTSTLRDAIELATA
jgi:PAS domain S-box-containing protein